jgi:DNA-binding NarL/FixJ family response regulator
MATVRVLIVDDSPFSRNLIADALIDGGYEVAGQAGDLDECLEQFRTHRPDVVTMDMVMPGADGLECIRALKMEDPDVKVIIVSSMKDDELVQEAKKLRVAGYVQKPVNADELVAAVRSAVAPDEMYALLSEWYPVVFKEALASGITMCTKSVTEIVEEGTADGKYSSMGVAVVIGIVGRYSGSMIFDLSFESASELTRAALRREPKNDQEILAMVAEFANIVSGNACSVLNKKCKDFRLRVTPPSIFYGGSPEIASPNLDKKAVHADTTYGRMFLSIGFRRGAELWM